MTWDFIADFIFHISKSTTVGQNNINIFQLLKFVVVLYENLKKGSCIHFAV